MQYKEKLYNDISKYTVGYYIIWSFFCNIYKMTLYECLFSNSSMVSSSYIRSTNK